MNDIIQGQLSEALARMNEALRILDGMGAPGDIGGHLILQLPGWRNGLGLRRLCRTPLGTIVRQR